MRWTSEGELDCGFSKIHIVFVFLFYIHGQPDTEINHTEIMKLLLVYPISILSFFLAMCSTNINTPDYPEWEGWHQAPPEISIEVIAPDTVTLSEPLEYSVKATNRTDKNLKLIAGKSLNRTFEFDLAVVNEDLELIWVRFPRDAVYQRIAFWKKLSPGESYVMQDSWNLKDLFGEPISTGRYTLYGGLHSLEIDDNDGESVFELDYGPVVTGSRGVEIEVVGE